ncbi:MAG: AraC family transcriptional regulator, partial [Bacteroidales bacterium]|nr:AraC family transcriptional regulator [Bacteroidales bacterium]
VGFNDPKYFARCFRKRFNISPSNYRKCLIDDKSS